KDSLSAVAVIGVRNFGPALINYHFSQSNNTKRVIAFDRSKKTAKTENGNIPIDPIEQVEEKLNGVEVAILTVPAAAAQDIANRLIDCGIKGIVNFTPARLTIPDDVRIHHIDLSVELQSFIYFLKNYPMNE